MVEFLLFASENLIQQDGVPADLEEGEITWTV